MIAITHSARRFSGDVAGVVTVYLVKSYLGIDLTDGPSLFHDWFF